MKNFKFLRGEKIVDFTDTDMYFPTSSFNYVPNARLNVNENDGLISQIEYNRRRDAAAEEARRRFNLLAEMRMRQNDYNTNTTNLAKFYSGANSQIKIKPKLTTRIKMYFQEYFYIDPIGLSGIIFMGGLFIILGAYIIIKSI